MARPTFSELHPVGASLLAIVSMKRLVTPQAILVRGIVAYHALLESGHGRQGGRSCLRLLVRLGTRLPVVFVNLACFDAAAEGYLFNLLEDDPVHLGGRRVIVVLGVSEF